MRAQDENDKDARSERWMSVDDSADHLNVSKDIVHAWVTKESTPGYRVARFWLFKRDDVDAWVPACGAASPSTEAGG